MASFSNIIKQIYVKTSEINNATRQGIVKMADKAVYTKARNITRTRKSGKLLRVATTYLAVRRRTRSVNKFLTRLRRATPQNLLHRFSRFLDKKLGLYDARQARSSRKYTDQLNNLEQLIEDTKGRMRHLTTQLDAGEIDADTYKSKMASQIKGLNLATAKLFSGSRIGKEVIKQVNAIVKKELAKLDGFINDVLIQLSEGKPLAKSIYNRATQFANTARPTARAITRQTMSDIKESSNTNMEERRVLSSAENCSDCIDIAGEGWQEIGTLPPIGDSECGYNCKCYFEYRVAEDDVDGDS